MKTAIILATSDEIKLSDLNFSLKKQMHHCYLNNEESLLLCISGIGKANAASMTNYAINHYQCDHVINIGSAGTINDNDNLLEVYQINKSYYWDVNVTCFNYKLNQLPNTLEHFTSANNLWKKFNLNHLTKANCATGDSFISNLTTLNTDQQNFFVKNQINLIDMEAAAIAQICWQHQCKFNAIKIVSDKVSTNNHHTWKQNLSKIQTIVAKLINQIQSNL